MKKVIFNILPLFIFISTYAQNMSLDEVLDKHYKKINQEKRKEVETLVFEGKMNQGIEIPIKLIIQRPNKARMEGTVQGSTFVQAYNGETGFMIMPNSPTPQDLNDQQLESMQEMASVDSEFYTARKKGYDMELLGKEKYEDSEVYLIKVSNKKGNETTYYLDSENFLIIKGRTKANVQGQTIESDTYYSDYKEVEGMLFPFTFISKNTEGQTISEIFIDTLVLDAEVADDQFERP